MMHKWLNNERYNQMHDLLYLSYTFMLMFIRHVDRHEQKHTTRRLAEKNCTH